MKLANFAERTHIWPRLRDAMITFWQPLILLATIPTIITLAASLPFAVNLIVIMPLFGVAAYLAHDKYGVTGLVSVVSVFVLGCFFKLLSSISVIGPIASRNPPIQDRIGSLVVLVAMILLFAAATYFTGRYGEEGQARQAGMVTIIVVLVLIAFMLGGLNLG
jgi:hypothetical protein